MSAPDLFVQWKGTKVCADFRCGCGNTFHFDQDFLYYIKCHSCGKTYQVPHTLALVEITEEWSDPMAPHVLESLTGTTEPEYDDQ